MNRLAMPCAVALLAIAGHAGAATPATAPLTIEPDQLPNYWTPVSDKVALQMTSDAMGRASNSQPMATSVTIRTTIGSDGKVKSVDVIAKQPTHSNAAWAVAAAKAYAYTPTPGNPDRTPVQWTHEIKMLDGPPPAAAKPAQPAD